MQNQLFVTDLDGTLLNNHCELSKYSKSGIIELLESGVNFTIATARGIRSIKEIVGDIPLKLPVICNNGAYIRDYQTWKPLKQYAFSPAIVKSVLMRAEAHGLEPFITSTDGQKDFISYNLVINKGMQWFEDERLRVNDPRMNPNIHFSQVLNHKITCLTIIGKLGPVKSLQKKLDLTFGSAIQSNIMINPYQGNFHWLTVQDAQATKGNAVKWLAANYGFNKEQITVFGDQVNDISMFDVAGTKISVRGAIEQLKNQADLVLGSNNNDAVIKYIQEKVAIFSA